MKWHWGKYVAAAVAIVLGLFLESPWPVAVLALLLSISGLAGVREQSECLRLSRRITEGPLRTVLRFTVRLDDSKAWDVLGLSGAERNALAVDLSRPAGFIAERWGSELTRWRTFTLNVPAP